MRAMRFLHGQRRRALHAQLVDQLLAAPPRVIAFDLGFFEQTPDDLLLTAAFQRAQQVTPPTRIVLGAVGTAPAGQPLEQAVGGDLRFVRGLVPIDSLANNASLGLTNVVPDSRGTVRRIPLLAQTGDTEVPALGLSVLAAYVRRPQAYDSVTADTLAVAGRRIPIDATRSAAINFFGPPDVTFHSYSFVDVLRGRVDPSAWKNATPPDPVRTWSPGASVRPLAATPNAAPCKETCTTGASTVNVAPLITCAITAGAACAGGPAAPTTHATTVTSRTAIASFRRRPNRPA